MIQQEDPDAASLLLEDFLQRKRHGEEPRLAEYKERFPQHEKSMAALVSIRSIVGPAASAALTLRLPGAGVEIFGFRLKSSLGRGAFASVWLSEQANLAGRHVVLKVSAIEGDEPQTLAQLQHTSIVPIYSVHEDHAAGLRAVCMPFFGGSNLASVLRQLWQTSPHPLRGSEFVEALKAADAVVGGDTEARPRPGTSHTTADSASPAEGLTPVSRLREFSYFQTAAWVIAQLADGLQHAHNRGILHRDIKPSNILISSEGQPLLLDFNLSQDQESCARQETLGGTIAYMAPEHLRAAISQVPPQDVDRRSDLYSLGFVLGEMLIGADPFDQSAGYSVLPYQIEALAEQRSNSAPSVRQHRADTPWTLESIVRKCLAPDPDERYQEAEQLADDLRRFLDDRPLRYAPELSRVEQIQKYFRRHPRLAFAAPDCRRGNPARDDDGPDAGRSREKSRGDSKPSLRGRRQGTQASS